MSAFCAALLQLVKMVITVVIIYGICWLPLHSITLIGDAHPSIYTYKYIQTVWISCHWLAMSNCCYNPMVYCWMNSKFRTGFKSALRCLPCVHYDRAQQSALATSTCKVNYRSVAGVKQAGGAQVKVSLRPIGRCMTSDSAPHSSSGQE